jgi:toxin ParE1/3/4
LIFRRSLLLSIDLQSNSLRAERQTAIRMLDTLEKEILSLSTLPNRVALTEEEPWHSAGIRKIPVKNYLVYFWVNEERKKVQITAVVFGQRDQRNVLQNMKYE